MSAEFRALRVFKTDGGEETRLVTLSDADLMDGDVDVRVDYSAQVVETVGAILVRFDRAVRYAAVGDDAQIITDQLI